MKNKKLQSLRALNPFVPIMEFPTYVNMLGWTGGQGTVTKSVTVPDNAEFVTITSSATFAFLISRGNPAPIENTTGDGAIVININSSLPFSIFVDGVKNIYATPLSVGAGRLSFAFTLKK